MDLERGLYRNRHLVKNAFTSLTHYWCGGISVRQAQEKRESVVAMACAVPMAAHVKQQQTLEIFSRQMHQTPPSMHVCRILGRQWFT